MTQKELFNSLLAKAKEIDLRRYIEGLGHPPKATNRPDWRFNCWWCGDEGGHLYVSSSKWMNQKTGEHGDIIDIAIMEYNTRNKVEALQKLLGRTSVSHTNTPTTMHGEHKAQINGVRSLSLRPLVNYIDSRGITSQTATKFVSEVFYNFGNGKRNMFGIGFKNDVGGWEIRNTLNSMGKITVGDKYYTTKRFSDCGEWVVFEGFFDFLSYWEQFKELETELKKRNYLILNSTSNTEKALQLLERENAKTVFLILDNDEAGDKATAQFVAKFGNLAQDKRNVLHGYNDYNDYLKALKGK